MRRDAEMGTIITTQDIEEEGVCDDGGESGAGSVGLAWLGLFSVKCK